MNLTQGHKPAKAKQASFVSLDVRKNGRFDKPEDNHLFTPI
jgi:hypothetical protein